MADSSATVEEIQVDPWTLVDDGSTVADRKAFGEMVAEYTDKVKGAISAARASVTRNRAAAPVLMAIREAILINGHPDWKAASATYRELVSKSEGLLYATPQEKSKVQGGIRQELARNFLEPGIVAYVLRTGDHGVKVGDLKWTESKNDVPSVIASFEENNPAQAKLRAQIAAEYVAAGLSLPVKFGGQKPGTGGGTQKADPANPAHTVEQGVAALDTLAPHAASQALLKATVAYANKVRTESEVTDRIEVEKDALRMGLIWTLLAKSLAGKITEAEVARLDSTLAEAATILTK